MRILLGLWHSLFWVVRAFVRIATLIYTVIGFFVVTFIVVGIFLVWSIASRDGNEYDVFDSLSFLPWEQRWAEAPALEDYEDEFVLSMDMDEWLFSSHGSYMGEPLKLLLAEAVDEASQDERVKAIVLRFNQYTPSVSDVQYLSRVFSKLANTEKKIYAHVGNFLSLAPYAFLQFADDIWVSPLSTLWLAGYGYENFYYADLLEALGTSAVVLKRKEYKSAADSLLRSHSSEFEREQVQSLLDNLYNQSKQLTLVGDRITSTGSFDAMVDTGIYTPFRALNDGLIDHVGYYRDMLDDLEGAFRQNGQGENEKEDMAYVGVFSYMTSVANTLRARRGGDEKRVAYINLEGPIYSTPTRSGGFFTDNIGINSSEWESVIRNFAEDEGTAGIILRISSGGGEAFASDILWGAIRALNDEKPVVVLVDDIAASGGYYMAAAGEKIVMERATVTGSIGAVFAYLEHGRLLDRVGVTAERFLKGRFSAGLLSPSRKPNDAELEKLNESLDHVYDGFTSRVSEGRNLSIEEVENFAKGRVWSGEQALDLGLADIEGGLPEAVDEMKQLLELEDDEVLVLQIYEQDRDFRSILADLRDFGVYTQKISRFAVTVMQSLGLSVNGNNGQIMMRSGYSER